MRTPGNWRELWIPVSHMLRLTVTSAAGLLATAAVVGGNGTDFGTGILALSTTALVFVSLTSHHRSRWHYVGMGLGALCACAAGWSWLSNVENAGGNIMQVLRSAGFLVAAALLFGLLLTCICWSVWNNRRKQ